MQGAVRVEIVRGSRIPFFRLIRNRVQEKSCRQKEVQRHSFQTDNRMQAQP